MNFFIFSKYVHLSWGVFFTPKLIAFMTDFSPYSLLGNLNIFVVVYKNVDDNLLSF